MTTAIQEKEPYMISSYSKLALEQKPPYLIFSKLEIGTDVLSELHDVYGIREIILSDLMTGSAIDYRRNNFAIKFDELASEVEQDCMLVSSPSQIALHPAYQKIIGMGERIIPLLIKKLNEIPTMWFWALESISGYNPVPQNHKGNIPVMVKDWQNWYNENGKRFFY